MSLALGVHTVASQVNGISVTTGPVTTTPGSTVVLCGSWQGGAPFVGFSDSKANTWVEILSELGANPTTRMYYAKNIVGGAGHTFTLTNTADSDPSIWMVEILGAQVAAPLDQKAQTPDTVSPYDSPSVTTVEANEFLVGFFAGDSAQNPTTQTVAAPFNLLDEVTNGAAFWCGATAYRIVSSIASYIASFTQTGATLSRVWIATFKEEPSGAVVLLAQSIF